MGPLSKKRKYIFFSILLFALGLFIASAAFAQTQITISTSVPGTYPPTSGTGGPGAFVANFYQFALMIGGVLAFGVVVYGGVKYMASAGNPSGQSDAKEWIEAALLGLLLLVGAYFILSVINPQLLNLNLPSLTPVNISSISVPYNPPGSTNGPSGSGTCTAPPAGPCTVANLQGTCMGGNAASAAEICSAESSGNAVAGGDKSTNGQPVSIGLFQINLTANTIGGLNCPSAFDHAWHAPGVCGKTNGCGPSTITNPKLYAQCVAAAQNTATNIAKACSLSNNGQTWNAWSTHTACGL
ncbi:MAG: hypothetical protein ABR884_04120 [Minisyncoccia bacterium]|jgi:hypothetical protein